MKTPKESERARENASRGDAERIIAARARRARHTATRPTHDRNIHHG